MTDPVISSSAPTTGVGPDNQAQLRQAAEAFEAVFLRQVIGSMRAAKLGDDLFGSAAADQFRDIADGRLADSMAHQGSFGIAEMLLQQFGHRPAAASAALSAGDAS